MNILVCTSSDSSYNSLRPELEIYIGLAKAGCNITIITSFNEIYTPRFKEYGIEVIEHLPKHKISRQSIRLIRQTIKQKNIDLVYATNSRAVPNAAFACIGTPAKLVVYRGTTGGLYKTDPTTYITTLHPRVDGVICVSKAVEKYVKRRIWKRSLENVVTIYKGHNIDWYDQPEVDLTQFGTDKSQFNIACVANARPHKGLIYVIEAAAQLADLGDLNILLVGKKISKEPYVSAIENSGMKERIHLTGYRNDAPEIIAACDLLILPSIREGLPRVILESLAYKTPVITSANEGSMEIIDDGENGFVVPLRDGTAIAEKVRLLHDNPQLLKELSERAQDKLKNELSAQHTVENYLDYFKRLISQ